MLIATVSLQKTTNYRTVIKVSSKVVGLFLRGMETGNLCTDHINKITRLLVGLPENVKISNDAFP